MHDLNSLELTFSEVISGHYIKMKEVVQHDSGKLFATAFINDGLFRVKIFNQSFMTDEININEMIDLDNHTMPNQQFQDPCINCCFISDDVLFVNFFHNFTRKHFHFIWSISAG